MTFRARLVLDCTAEEFAAACGDGSATIDVAVVDVQAGDTSRPALMGAPRQRTHHEFEGDAGAPLRIFLGPAGGTHG